MSLSCMFHHLVLPREYLRALAINAGIRLLSAVNSLDVPRQVAFFPKWFFVRAARVGAEQRRHVDIFNMSIQGRARTEDCL